MEIIFGKMTSSNLRLVVFFVGKTDSEGGPKTTSMCFVMITYNDLTEFLSMIFPNGIYHLEKRKKCKVLEVNSFNN